ncbi:TIGR01620 family protein, partial [Citrobacter sp. JGM124]|nr:TIGR01620 family protein [Citrobacter sp. JGM124]
MNQSIKPRIDFAATQQDDAIEKAKTARTFSEQESEYFTPQERATETDDDRSEAIVVAALRPKHSLWRRLVTCGLALFGLSVIAEGGLWVYRAWVDQDWIALSAGAAGTLIVIAGVGSV